MAAAWVDPPGDGSWGERQQLLGRLQRLGYRVAVTGIGRAWRLVLS